MTSPIPKRQSPRRQQASDAGFEQQMSRPASRIPPRPRRGVPAPTQDFNTQMFDQLLGMDPSQLQDRMAATQSGTEGGARIPTYAEAQAASEAQFHATRKAEFDAVSEREDRKVEIEIAQAKEIIKSEIKRLEKMNIQMNDKLATLQKLALENTQKKGVYYVRFMELMMELIRSLSAQVSESNTWLEAMISKKKKRGSLFATRSKSQGTQYSMSQEISLARSSG